MTSNNNMNDTNKMYQDKLVGIIGSGNMGKTLVKSFLNGGSFSEENVLVFDKDHDKKKDLVKTYGVSSADTSKDLVKQCDVVFLAVKPQDFDELLDDISEQVTTEQLLVSIAAGISVNYVKQKLFADAKIIRLMPNTPCLVGEGVIAMAHEHPISESDLELVTNLVRQAGEVVRVKEDLMNAVTGLSGSGPAYVFMMIQAMANGGVKLGLSQEQSLTLAAQTVKGAAEMIQETGEHPEVLKDKVSSPAGTTIHALQYLEDSGVRGTFMEAVEKAHDRAQEMNDEND